MPEWLTDLQLKVNNIPKSISLTGIYDKGTHTIQADATQAINGISYNPTSRISLHRIPRKSKLTLTSNAHKYVSQEYEIKGNCSQ